MAESDFFVISRDRYNAKLVAWSQREVKRQGSIQPCAQAAIVFGMPDRESKPFYQIQTHVFNPLYHLARVFMVTF